MAWYSLRWSCSLSSRSLRRLHRSRGAALLDGRHHAVLGRRQNGSDLGSEGVAVAAKDLPHGEGRARHDRHLLRRCASGSGPWEQVQRTGGRADRGGRDPQVARRGLQTPMPEQELDGAQVGAGLEQLYREGMAK